MEKSEKKNTVKYEMPEVQIVRLDVKDVLTESDSNQGPWDPQGYSWDKIN